MRAINLLPRDDARRGSQKTQWVVIVPVIGAVLISAVLSMMFLSASGKVNDRKTTLAELQAELAAIPTPDASKVQTQTALAADKQSRVTALNAALTRRVAWDRIFRELSLVLPDDVWLSTMSAKAPVSPSLATPPPAAVPGTAVAATQFTIDGYTYSQPAVARLLSRMSVIPDLVNVQLQQSALTKVGTSQAVHFTIAADIRGPGGGS
ncbi:MAG: PilN domain-containing protein [Gaiellaceae bacterium]